MGLHNNTRENLSVPQHRGGLINKYRDRLPVAAQTRAISLEEGDTPLVELHNISKDLDIPISLHVKYEGMNPTGSFKDRGMTMAVTKAVEEGSQAIICASTGNTSASAAAYAARAGIKAFVLIPDGQIAMGKLAQAMMHGSVVIQIKGNFDEGMHLVKEIAEQAPLTIVNSINPYRLQGQKTVAFEVVEQLGAAPDYHCLPVGNAGNITAHWMGYAECARGSNNTITKACSYCSGKCPYARDLVQTRPVMVGYQASGAAPFIKGKSIENPETIATAIRIGNPQSWEFAWSASRESDGWFDHCTDEEILKAHKLLAEREGIFCEPASAISIAGALRDIRNGKIPPRSTVVCTVTGHGLKDPNTAISQCEGRLLTVTAKTDTVKRAIFDNL